MIRYKIIILFLTASISCGLINAQGGYTLRYHVRGLKANKSYLMAVHGGAYDIIDSCTIHNGMITFPLKNNLPVGMYRISFADSLYTDIIFNHESIEMENDIKSLHSGLRIVSSRENSLYYDYWKYSGAISDTIAMIASAGDRMYTASGHKLTPQLDSMQKKIQTLNAKLAQNNNRLIEEAQGLFVSKIISAYNMPEYYTYLKKPGAYPYASPMDFLRDHYFDNVDLADSLMLNTEVIYAMVTDYLNTFGDPPSTPNYNRAIDTVMNRVAANPGILDYTLKLLLNTFENTEWEKVFIHLVDTYVASNNCEIADAGLYAKKSAAIKMLGAGNPSPAAILNDVHGKKVPLYDISASIVLVFFWSSDCPHCRKIIAELKTIYSTYHPRGFEIYGIAMDTIAQAWKAAVNSYDMKWINVSDLRGPGSDLLITFNAWETPCFLLLDDQKRIISRPMLISQIRDELEERLK
jgi:peroxiredoxin